jgi:hypothetical protein
MKIVDLGSGPPNFPENHFKFKVYVVMYTFTAVRYNGPPRNLKISFYIESPLVWKIVAFKRAILKLLANRSLDQN